MGNVIDATFAGYTRQVFRLCSSPGAVWVPWLIAPRYPGVARTLPSSPVFTLEICGRRDYPPYVALDSRPVAILITYLCLKIHVMRSLLSRLRLVTVGSDRPAPCQIPAAWFSRKESASEISGKRLTTNLVHKILNLLLKQTSLQTPEPGNKILNLWPKYRFES